MKVGRCVSVIAASGCLLTSGCARWVLGDFSRPAMIVDGKVVLGEKPVGLKPVPFDDLEFKVSDQGSGFTVTLSSRKWDIEGCGVGTGNGEMTIHSIAGRKSPGGDEFIVRESGSRAGCRIFVEDARGRRHEIP